MALNVILPGATNRVVDITGLTGTYPDATTTTLVPEGIWGRTDAGLWVPVRVLPDGSLSIDAAVVGSLTNLLLEMADGTITVEALRADISRLLNGGEPLQAFTTPIDGRGVAAGGVVSAQALRQGFQAIHDMGHAAFGASRKYLGVDPGAYTSPVAAAAAGDLTSAVTFTGVNLLGTLAQTGRVAVIYNATDRTYHAVTNVVDPVGAVVGTLTVSPAIPSANAILRIPYTDVPHSWNAATDATQTIAVAAPPKGVNGPAVLLSNAAQAEVAGTYNIDVPVSNYDLLTVQIFWDAAAGDTYQWDLLARIDDQAAGDWVNINAWFTVAGTALGAPADPGLTVARLSVRTQLRELRVQRIKANNNGNAAIRVWVMEGR